jgi:NAD(P)-dependent dehydrogenase (short-subunit alcohol dehydrogenase family)
VNTHTIIFGGTKGIGRVLAASLTAKGQRVTVVGRSGPTNPASADGLERQLTCDLSDPASIRSLLEQIKAANCPPNYLVFLQRFRGKDGHWQGEFDTSLTALRTLVESLSECFAENGDRAIVAVGSLAGRFVAPDQSIAYHVAKAALVQMIQFYAVSLGRHQIRVNGVSPGATIKPESAAYYGNNKSLQDLYANICPLGRMGRAEDVVSVIEFLCSPAAGFITGQNIIVDGGISLHSHESLARRLTGI